MSRVLDRVSSVMEFGGGAQLRQGSDEVLIRDPAVGKYSPPSPAAETARLHWEYAVMSENVYERVRAARKAKGEFSQAAFESACRDKTETLAIPLRHWKRWDDFPGKDLQDTLADKGLYLEVLERERAPYRIAVVFEGTNRKQISDWEANLRWFLRFAPRYRDQYTLAMTVVAQGLRDRITERVARGEWQIHGEQLTAASGAVVGIVSVGHSLGGGLAQQLAYAFKQEPITSRGPKVSEVFAFDPSPVTGWFSTPDPPRSYNSEGLIINRVFEHGEVLAYLRLLTSRLAVTSQNPAIWEYRYNFARTTPVRSHGMRRLACSLALAAQPWETAD
jgi:hypothetical protein